MRRGALFSFFKFPMSRAASRLAPILPYGLDIPFTSFSAAAHRNYKFNYISDRGSAHMKFFEQPIYTHVHGTVRMPQDTYGKVSFSVLPDEANFLRLVEKDVVENLDRIVDMAEPNLHVSALPMKSITYENLVKLKIAKTVGQDLNGKIVEEEKHAELLVKSTKVLLTVEIHGIYHSDVSKGVIARVHCYRIVESF